MNTLGTAYKEYSKGTHNLLWQNSQFHHKFIRNSLLFIAKNATMVRFVTCKNMKNKTKPSLQRLSKTTTRVGKIPLYFHSKKQLFHNSDEAKFYYLLVKLLEPFKLIVLTDVNLQDVIGVPSGLPTWHKKTLEDMVVGREVHFLVCDRKSTIEFAVELEKTSKSKMKSKKEKDLLKYEIFYVASIPLITFDTKKKYSLQGVLQKIVDEYYFVKGTTGPFKRE